LAIAWDGRIEVDQLSNLLCYAIGYAGDYWPAQAMSDQHDILQILVPEEADDILDVSFQARIWASEMGAFAYTRKGRAENLVPGHT